MSHEKIVKGHRKQHELAELLGDELLACLVHRSDFWIDCHENAPVVRIPKADGYATTDAESCGVVQKRPAEWIIAIFRGIPDQGNVAVVSSCHSGIDFDIPSLTIKLHPFARQRRPHIWPGVTPRRLGIRRHAVHETVEAQFLDNLLHDRLERLPFKGGPGEASDTVVDDVPGNVGGHAGIDDR